MKSLFLSSLLLLGLIPQAKAQIDPNVHKLCSSVADYMGCVKANSNFSPEPKGSEKSISSYTSTCIENLPAQIAENYGKFASEPEIARLCAEANKIFNQYSNITSDYELEEQIRAFLLIRYDAEGWDAKPINEYISMARCALGFTRSKHYPTPGDKGKGYLTPLNSEGVGRWQRLCELISRPEASFSAGLTVYKISPNDTVYLDLKGARRKPLNGFSSRYLSIAASDSVTYSGFTIPGQRGYIDCEWGGSSWGSWDSYTSSNSGYCSGEDSTEDTVIPDTVRNQMWNFTLDCWDNTFDRNKDSIGWQNITKSRMAMVLHDVFCPIIDEIPME